MNRPPVLPAADDNRVAGARNPTRFTTVARIVEAIARGDGEALPGGVSSDIKMLECDGARYCIKQALPKLKVEADWRAPIERNHSEAEWLRVVAEISPSCVPRILHEERAAGWFVMEYLPPEQYPVWKGQLRDGAIDPSMAAHVGSELAKIHAHTANRAELAQRFATDHIFYPIRLEPYLIATGGRHPDVAARLRQLADATLHHRVALVHGDVSPKNILAGDGGPVFLDAECAWYGDPAFDLAFVLNHLLLKCVWRPQWTSRYLACFDALSEAYLSGVTWESRAAVETRTAHLLPGLLLGRVDGKSPAEYVTADFDKDSIRAVARVLLLEPVATLAQIRNVWMSARTSSAAAGR